MPVGSRAVVVVAVFIAGPREVIAVAVVPPNTTPPPGAVPVPKVIVPVHVAPIGQQAICLALSVVHTDPTVQHAPP